MNNDNFIWTDELVKEFANNLFIDTMADENIISEFKQSKQQNSQPKKEYEILECMGATGKKHPYQKNVCLGADKESLPCTIFSVRRLSDNEVFSIDDITDYGRITSFNNEINDDKNIMFAVFENNRCGKLSSIQKVKQPQQKKPLFTRTLEQAKERLAVVQKQEREFNIEISNNNKQIRQLEIKNKKIARKISSHMKYINLLTEEIQQKINNKSINFAKK